MKPERAALLKKAHDSLQAARLLATDVIASLGERLVKPGKVAPEFHRY